MGNTSHRHYDARPDTTHRRIAYVKSFTDMPINHRSCTVLFLSRVLLMERREARHEETEVRTPWRRRRRRPAVRAHPAAAARKYLVITISVALVARGICLRIRMPAKAEDHDAYLCLK